MNKEQYCAITGERMEKYWEQHESDTISSEAEEEIGWDWVNEYWGMFGTVPSVETITDILQIHQDNAHNALKKFESMHVIEAS